uniref:Uncharacterized protein n=1 Tax=Anguilla anguilla TaxID=7936 RepID=A0A0E9R734_ANGAN
MMIDPWTSEGILRFQSILLMILSTQAGLVLGQSSSRFLKTSLHARTRSWKGALTQKVCHCTAKCDWVALKKLCRQMLCEGCS